MKKTILFLTLLFTVVLVFPQEERIYKDGVVYEKNDTYPKEIPANLVRDLNEGKKDSVWYDVKFLIGQLSLKDLKEKQKYLQEGYSLVDGEYKNLGIRPREKNLNSTGIFVFLGIIFFFFSLQMYDSIKIARKDWQLSKCDFYKTVVFYVVFLITWILNIFFVKMYICYYVVFVIAGLISSIIGENYSPPSYSLHFGMTIILSLLFLGYWILLRKDSHIKLEVDLYFQIIITLAALLPTLTRLSIIYIRDLRIKRKDGNQKILY